MKWTKIKRGKRIKEKGQNFPFNGGKLLFIYDESSSLCDQIPYLIALIGLIRCFNRHADNPPSDDWVNYPGQL